MKTKSLYVIASSLFISNIAFALPSGGSVSAGSATISQTNSQTTINQTTQNAVINWNGFDTSSNESVVFNQPNSTSNTLNRINSGLPTNFAGSLTANGNVFIVNSSGIVFAKGSKVDVAGLVATTLDVNNDDFMNGHNKFTLPQGSENSSVINNGTLTAEDQGVIALIAPNVSNGNSGIIQAHIGSVVLATGRTFVIDFANDQLINFDSSSLIKNGHIESSGIISANGGRILMTNNAISQTLDNVISVSGTVEANAAYNGFHHEIILTNTNNAINVSGNVSSSKVELNAGSGITISGAIKSNDNFVAKTTEGNIAVNGSIDTDNVSGNVALTANDGAIIESDSGEIIADTLSTNSSKGTILNSAHNNAYVFSATNSQSGDLDFQNNEDLTITEISQTGGNLNIVNTIGDIHDDKLPLYVSGTSSFSALGGGIYFTNDNQFVGTVTFISKGNVDIRNSTSNLILGSSSIGGYLNINQDNGSITQVGALTIGGEADFSTEDAVITLANPGNKISGQITLHNSGSSDYSVTLNNSIATDIYYASAGGVLTIISGGTLTLDPFSIIMSGASDAPNGHSIIFDASSFSYAGNFFFSPDGNNSWLVYLPGPSAILPGSQPLPGDNSSTPIWGQTYSSAPPSTIAAGNHFVYASSQTN